MNFTIYYKDSIGRRNQAQSTGKDATEAENKFKTLYPECTITNTTKS